MATPDKKQKSKKIESLRESISKLESQKALFQGNKTQIYIIQKIIDRFEDDIRRIKTLD
jgi:hypothetical protein